jgi:hypothetical protein
MAKGIKCTCGHSWNKSDSSKKDMYVCHMCGKDNTMKDGGWLDNYGKKPNPNEVDVSVGPGFVGMGNDTTGRNYSPAWGGQFQSGGFLQPTSPKLPKGYVIPYNTPSTELAMSIGGEDGEPAYLIPSFKGGKKLKDPIAEYKKTGEHLGGPFKTWQEAEKFGEMRHKYVEKGQDIPTPLKTWGDMEDGGYVAQVGKSIPTMADSLALYNNSKKVLDYYKDKKYKDYTNIDYKKKELYKRYNKEALAEFIKLNKTGGIKVPTDGGKKSEIKTIPVDSYYKKLDANRYLQRERMYGALDTKAPMQLFDNRITPTLQSFYANEKVDDPLYEDNVSIYSYDPILVKPVSMLTSKERATRLKRYGKASGLIDEKVEPSTSTEKSKTELEKKKTPVIKKSEETKPAPYTPTGSKKYILNGIEVSEEDFLGTGNTTGGSKRIIYSTPKLKERKVLRLDGTPETDPEKIRKAMRAQEKDGEDMQDGGTLPDVVVKGLAKPKKNVLVHDPSDYPGGHRYSLKKTVTPYKTNQQIKKNTEAVENPNDIDFLFNYRHTSADDSDNRNAMAVPYQGMRHWNIDRFIIDPEFGGGYTNLKAEDDSMEAKRRNVLADMFKYQMFQHPEQSRGKSFRQAKRFVKKEIDPRVSGAFFENYMLGNTPVPGDHGSITTYANDNPFYKAWRAMQGEEDFVNKEYRKNPWDENKIEKVSKDYLINTKKLSRKETRQQIKKWKTELPSMIDNYLNPKPIDLTLPVNDMSSEEAYFKNMRGDNLPNYAMGGSIPGAVGFTYARTINPAPSNGKYAKKTKASAQNGKEMKFYQEGLDFKPNSIAQDGAIIDPMGQWAHPGEVTIIPGTDITMEGVDYPVLGISDTGDQQMMYPGEDYDFDGEYVTEYPMMKEGGWLSKFDTAQSGKTFMDKVDADIAKLLGPNTDKNRSRGDIASYFPETKIAKQTYETNKALAEADQKRKQSILAEAVANAKGKQATVKQDNRTPRQKEIAQQQVVNAYINEAQGNSPLAQTFGSFTPSGYNPGAGSVAANQFVKTMPLIAAGSLAATEVLPYLGAAMNAPIAGVAGLTGNNIMNAGFAYEAAKNLPNVGSSIKTAYQNPTLGNIGNAALETGVTALDILPFAADIAPGVKSLGKQIATKIEKIAADKASKKVFEPADQEAMDEWYRVGMLPKTTNQESIDVLNAFKERIKTPEGKRRLKQLGISSDKDLQKLEVFDEPNTYGVYYGGFNKIGVHPKLDAKSSRNIVRHEIEHGVQRAYVDSELQRLALKDWPWNAKKIRNARYNLLNNETTAVDKMLGDLELRRKPTPNKVWKDSVSSEPIDDPSDLAERLLDRQNATDYFTSGSEGREKAPFVAELQQYMLDKGYIKHPYETITPEKVKEVMGEAYFDKVYPLRIFQIMKNTDKNHKIVASALNKLLAAPVIVAGGAATLSNTEEKENGGWLNKYK